MVLTGTAQCQLPSVTAKPAMPGRGSPGILAAWRRCKAIHGVDKSGRVRKGMRILSSPGDRLGAISNMEMTICAEEFLLFSVSRFCRLLPDRRGGIEFPFPEHGNAGCRHGLRPGITSLGQLATIRLKNNASGSKLADGAPGAHPVAHKIPSSR